MTKVKRNHKWTIKAQAKKYNSFHLSKPTKCSEISTKTVLRQTELTKNILKPPKTMILPHQMPKDSLWIIETKRIERTYPSTIHLRNTTISVRIPFKFRWITRIRQGIFWKSKYPLLPKTCLRKTWTKQIHKMKTFRILCRENRKDWSIF